MTEEFIKELQVLLNNNGIDTICNTPDYILAEYLTLCLETYAKTVQSRDTWFGFKPFSWFKVEQQESDRKCHTCKHYTSGERDGSCGSYICKGYSDWESEDKE